jgi:hypothetical protein
MEPCRLSKPPDWEPWIQGVGFWNSQANRPDRLTPTEDLLDLTNISLKRIHVPSRNGNMNTSWEPKSAGGDLHSFWVNFELRHECCLMDDLPVSYGVTTHQRDSINPFIVASNIETQGPS